MTKRMTIALAAVLALYSCKKTDAPAGSDNEETTEITQRSCGAMEVLEQQIAEDPSRLDRLNSIDDFARRAMAQSQLGRTTAGTPVTIPVVVNVVYNSTTQNIDSLQIVSQIKQLNADYNNANSDGSNAPGEFSTLRSTVNVNFTLVKINRKFSNKKSWGTNDAVKKSSMGGIDPTDPAHNLNIWVCNLGQSLLGYAQFPGGNPATDGVVILYSAFGSYNYYTNFTYASKYNLGRTATHEIGHWLNLRHIWGDATCGNDQVDDTPVAQTSNYGCPSYPKQSSCAPTPHNEMTMNYMDYTNDACMYMFTSLQAARMNATFSSSRTGFH